MLAEFVCVLFIVVTDGLCYYLLKRIEITNNRPFETPCSCSLPSRSVMVTVSVGRVLMLLLIENDLVST